jgi:hypothetical protein
MAAQVAAFVDELTREQLVVSAGEGSIARSPGEPGGTGTAQVDPGPWSTPTLTRFTDMQDLLVLDPVHEVDDRGWPHLPSAAEG